MLIRKQKDNIYIYIYIQDCRSRAKQVGTTLLIGIEMRTTPQESLKKSENVGSSY